VSLPVGTPTVAVGTGPRLSAIGEAANLVLTVGIDRTVVSVATGVVLGEELVSTVTSTDGVASVDLVPVDAAGFVDETGAPITFWAYQLELWAPGQPDPLWTRTFQPVTADGATVDLDLVPRGVPATDPVTGERVVVTSVAGLGGDIDAADLAGALDEFLTGGGPGSGDPVAWPVPGTPATFPPSAHDHVIDDVTGLQIALDGKETPTGAQTKATAARDSAVTTAAADATTKVNAERDRALGVEAAKADLVGGLVPTSQIPAVALTTGQAVTSRAAMLALTNVQQGDFVAITTGTDKGTYVLGSGSPTVFGSWLPLSVPTDAVTSVNGQSGTVTLGPADVGATPAVHATDTGNPHQVTKSQVGLGNVANLDTSTLANVTDSAAAGGRLALTTAERAAIAGAVPRTLVDAKGDMLIGSADDTLVRVPVSGTNGRVWTEDSTAAAGAAWKAPASGGSVSLAGVDAELAAPFDLVANTLTDVLSVSLGVGVWDVRSQATVSAGGTFNIDLLVGVGTATATVTAGRSTSSYTANGRGINMVVVSRVTVTVAGTFVMRLQSSGAPTVRSTSVLTGATGATVMTATKIG